MRENEQKPELEPEPWKKIAPDRSHVQEKNCGAGAVTLLWQLRSPEIIQSVAGHTGDPE